MTLLCSFPGNYKPQHECLTFPLSRRPIPSAQLVGPLDLQNHGSVTWQDHHTNASHSLCRGDRFRQLSWWARWTSKIMVLPRGRTTTRMPHIPSVQATDSVSSAGGRAGPPKSWFCPFLGIIIQHDPVLFISDEL